MGWVMRLVFAAWARQIGQVAEIARDTKLVSQRIIGILGHKAFGLGSGRSDEPRRVGRQVDIANSSLSAKAVAARATVGWGEKGERRTAAGQSFIFQLPRLMEHEC